MKFGLNYLPTYAKLCYTYILKKLMSVCVHVLKWASSLTNGGDTHSHLTDVELSEIVVGKEGDPRLCLTEPLFIIAALADREGRRPASGLWISCKF